MCVLGATLYPGALSAQSFASCSSGSDKELESSLREHEFQTHYLYYKFSKDGYIKFKTESDFRPASIGDIHSFIDRSLPARRVAVLFYAYSKGQFCTWALLPQGRRERHVSTVCGECTTQKTEARLISLHKRLNDSLGVSAIETRRAPYRGVRQAVSKETGLNELPAVLQQLADLLVPGPIVGAIFAASIDTVVVIPVSILGSLPFAALPIDNSRSLVDQASVIVAPGGFSLREMPKPWEWHLKHPIVVGDPGLKTHGKWMFPPLPGARREAQRAANLLMTTPMLGRDATRLNVEKALATYSDTSMIYFATHAVSDKVNPRDGSFLLLSDGLFYARQIDSFNLEGSPLVVLSACQTALGKGFEVGTIGLARAWHHAGASNVVMTLWSIDDVATADLMQKFLEALQTVPPDRALQLAMQKIRAERKKIVYWAGVTLFGVPARP